MSKNPTPKEIGKAPIVFLLGTSTAGKSTICEEIARQDLSLPVEQRLGWFVWGNDLEMEADEPRCRGYLEGNTKFQSIENSFPEVMHIFSAIAFGQVQDNATGKPIKLPLLKEVKSDDDSPSTYLPLSDEEFDKGLGEFLAQTGGRYNEGALRTLRSLAQDNPGNFRERAGFTGNACAERMFDRAIENSRNGLPTIIDVVPNHNDGEGGGIIEHFKKYSESKNFICPTNLTLVHVPVTELATRMGERNRQALAEGGNPGNRRDGIFPFQQYASVFGARSEDGVPLDREVLQRGDVHAAVYEFGRKGGGRGGERLWDMESQTEAALEAIKIAKDKKNEKGEIEKGLLSRLGFKDREESIEVGTKVKADAELLLQVLLVELTLPTDGSITKAAQWFMTLVVQLMFQPLLRREDYSATRF